MMYLQQQYQNGNPTFPVSSSVNCVEDLAPEYSNSRPYVPTSHTGEPDSIGNGDGNSVYS